MSWITDLKKAMRKTTDEDEETTGAKKKYEDDDEEEEEKDDDGEEEEEEEEGDKKRRYRTRKGISGTTTNPGLPKVGKKKADKYSPKPNGETTDNDEDCDYEEEYYTPRTRKGISGTTTNPGLPKVGKKKVNKYSPKPNGETTDDDEEDGVPEVHDPRSLDRRTGGGPVKFGEGGVTKKSLASQISKDTADAIEVSDILSDLALGVQSLADAGADQAAGVAAEVAKLNKGLSVIGKGLAFAIEQQVRVLKGIQADVAEMGVRPSPRQARLKILEKSFGDQGGDLEESLPESRAVMQEKTFQAIQKGKITNEDAARMEVAYNRGEVAVVKALWRKVNA